MAWRIAGISVALTVAAAMPLAAQSSEGFVTDFEDGATGWSFQQLNDQVKWNIDSSPTVFVSPTQTLNNVDSVTGIQAKGVADAYAPTGFFNGPGNRIIKHWCRFQFIETSFDGTRRWMKIGPQLLTNDVDAVFYYDDPTKNNGTYGGCFSFVDAPAADDPPPADPPSYVVTCGSADWHEHVYFVQQGSGQILHNGGAIANTLQPSQDLENGVVMQVGFFFEWTGKDDCPTGGGPVPAYAVVAWMIDDLFLSSSLFDPFGPDPEIPGGGGGAGGGGGGFDCVSGAVPAGGSGPGDGMLPMLIGALMIGAAGLQMKRRLAAVKL